MNGIQFGLVKKPVYLITAKVCMVGTPVPRKHFKLAYNRRRKDLQTISKILNRLMDEYNRIHSAHMPAQIDEHPVNVAPFATIHLDEPKTYNRFKSARMKDAQQLFHPSDYFSVIRYATLLFMTPTYPEANVINGWIAKQNNAWPTETIGEPVNQGLHTVALQTLETAIQISEGTFFSLAEIAASPKPESETVQ